MKPWYSFAVVDFIDQIVLNFVIGIQVKHPITDLIPDIIFVEVSAIFEHSDRLEENPTLALLGRYTGF
jgi:hypothetical protein